MKNNKTALLLLVFVIFSTVFFSIAREAKAASFTVRPVILDEKAKARDILRESLTLTNSTASKLNVYTFVNNIATKEGTQEFLDPSRADLSSSLANWIMIRRGATELEPREKKKIDFEIEVNLRAKPGVYHALINFAEASTRDDAEKKIVGAPSVTVNLEVLEDIKERLELRSFTPDKTFFSGFPVSFSYELENIGNRSLTPLGEIRIYDRGGKEVASIPINSASAALDPQANLKLASNWSGPGEWFKGMGKYKAFLSLEYGLAGRGTLQDTVFFWVIPLKQIIVIFTGLLIFIVVLAIRLHKRVRSSWFLALLLVVFSVLPLTARAQEQKLILSVTPPLFQLNIGPGEFWASSLKIINTNPYDLTLYASTMNFEASGEAGQGKFIPVVESDPEAVATTLAQWVEISPGPYLVPREKSIEVPFSLRIPQDAPPGGHYAAILVGTQPPREAEKGASIQVSSFVSSLLFVSIKGEVVEQGDIREFFAEHTLYQKPEVTFTLRFENKGNVHVQPQGDIAIYNMWGKERGKIFVNHKTGFGNVLPQSVRKFVFEWQGEEGLFEAGRYRAVATLAYGKEARQNDFDTTSFWIIPLAPVLGILGGLALLILATIFAIRAYIKRVLRMYQEK